MSDRSTAKKSSNNKRRRTSSSSPNPQRRRLQLGEQKEQDERPPSFFDAAGVVAPGIFGARRLMETKALYQESSCPWSSNRGVNHNHPNSKKNNNNTIQSSGSNNNTQCYASGGGKTSSRHLRRRTTSYNTRQWHRYPTGIPAAGSAAATTNAATQGVSDGNEAKKGDDDGSRNEPFSADSKAKTGHKNSVSRRGRRKNATILKSTHECWRRRMPPQQQLLPPPSYHHRDEEESRGEEMKQHSVADVAMIATTEKSKRGKTEGTPSKTPSASKTAAPSSSASVNWIPTHVWHAKRFHMLHQHCGWIVPLLHCDRGTKAALRLAGGSGHDDEEEKKCLVQDVTWRMQPLVVVVPITNVTQNNMSLLQTALARVIVPPISLLLHGMEGKEEAANVVENDDGVVMGQGMIHGVDLFPGAALGPVVWMLRKTPLLVASGETNDGIVSEAASSNMYLYLWVDPSIRESAIEVLNGATIAIRFVEPSADAEIEGHFETSAVSPAKYLGTCSATEGIAYLQLRGKHTLRCLVAALESFVGSSSGPTFDLGPLNQIVASIAAGKATEMSQIGEFKVMSLPSLTTRDNGPHPPVNDIILISQCPRDPSLACNYGVCGYDIICDPSLASALHLALVVKGGACPIGLTEEAALQLECEPPIPIFPRDYPDTQQGKAYWASHSSLTSSSSSSKASTKQQSGNENWKTIRTFFEGGQGRIRQQHAALVPLNWHALVSDSDDIDECRIACTDDHSYHYNKKHIVMVRGEAFGQPFVDALIGCCTTEKKNTSSFALDDSKTNKPYRHRRQRRLTQNPTHAVLAPLLSKKQATEHQGYLTKLLESLSLPAVLLCHVQISNGGPGTISSGALIHAMDESAVEALGFCTIGAFSPSRGQFYGLAIVGAARLLRALVASTTATLSPIDSVRSLKQQHQHAAVLVPRLGSDSQALLRQVQLRVRILDKTVWHEASLALML